MDPQSHRGSGVEDGSQDGKLEEKHTRLQPDLYLKLNR